MQSVGGNLQILKTRVKYFSGTNRKLYGECVGRKRRHTGDMFCDSRTRVRGLVDWLGAKLAPESEKGRVLARSTVSQILLLRLWL